MQKVTKYEKRPEDSREHMKTDVLWWSAGGQEPEIQKLIGVQAKGYEIRELEALLRSAAVRFGAEIINCTIVDGNELLNMHPDAKATICAMVAILF